MRVYTGVQSQLEMLQVAWVPKNTLAFPELPAVAKHLPVKLAHASVLQSSHLCDCNAGVSQG